MHCRGDFGVIEVVGEIPEVYRLSCWDCDVGLVEIAEVEGWTLAKAVETRVVDSLFAFWRNNASSSSSNGMEKKLLI